MILARFDPFTYQMYQLGYPAHFIQFPGTDQHLQVFSAGFKDDWKCEVMAKLGGVLFPEYVFIDKCHFQAALLSELFPLCVFPEVAIGDIAKATGVGRRAEYFMRTVQQEVPKTRFGVVYKQEFGSLWVFHSIN